MATARPRPTRGDLRAAASKAGTLSAIYNDERDGFGSIAETYAKARKKDPSITYADVRKFINKKTYQQTRHREKKHNSFISMGPLFEIELDVIDFGVAAGKEDSNRYALVGIDNFTKMVAVEPVYTKGVEGMTDATVGILKELGVPKQLYTDGEGYFKSGEFQELCDNHDIKNVITSAKANAVERVIRTLKENIFRRLDDRPVTKWESVIQAVVNKYNRTRHNTTDLSPEDATDPRNEMYVRYNLFDKAKNNRKWPPIEEGDYVRVRLVHQTGEKAHWAKYSEKKYKIYKIQNGTYTIKIKRAPDASEAQMRRTYQRFELLKVET